VKPYVENWNGVMNTFWTFGGGSGSSSQTNVPAGSRILDNVGSVSNALNRKLGRPNNQTYRVERYNRQRGSHVRSANDGSGVFTYLGQFAWMPYGSTPDVSVSAAVYNDCLSKLYEQVRGELDLSVDFIQWRQTTKMGSDAMTVLRKTRDAILSARKIERLIASSHRRDRESGYRWQRAYERRYRSDLSKKLADNWLQWQYGVKPLMNSIYGVVETFQKPQEPRVRIRARSKQLTTGTRNAGNLSGSGIDTKVHYVTSKRCEIVCEMAFAPHVIDDLARFSSLNPASLVWEMIPYSFVIDWVYDVGSYLRNVESALLYTNNFVSGRVTHTCRETGNAITKGVKNDGVWTTTVSSQGDYEVTYKQRAVLTSIPFPRAPRFEPKLGWQRLVSGAALLRQFIRR